MTDINEKLDSIIIRMDTLHDQIIQIRENNDKMNRHIDFVNSVFNIVRIPFFSIMNLASRLLPETNPNILETNQGFIKD